MNDDYTRFDQIVDATRVIITDQSKTKKFKVLSELINFAAMTAFRNNECNTYQAEVIRRALAEVEEDGTIDIFAEPYTIVE